MFAFQMGIVGYGNKRINPISRVGSFVSVVLTLLPRLFYNIIGVILLFTIIVQSGIINKLNREEGEDTDVVSE